MLFDLDGVLTPTAEVHMHAWQTMFEELFAAWDIAPPYTERDYFDYLDGKKRYDGVASLLRSRDVEVPWGDPSDDPSADTVCGIGNRKNEVFSARAARRGHRRVPRLCRPARRARGGRHPHRGRVEFEERRRGAAVAGIRDRFPVVMDGVIAERDHLASKPAPDVFVEAARMLGVDPARSVAVEDAISGVQSAAAGGFGLVVGVDRGVGPDELRDAGAHLVVDDLGTRHPSLTPPRRRRFRQRGEACMIDRDRFPVDPWRLVENTVLAR